MTYITATQLKTYDPRISGTDTELDLFILDAVSIFEDRSGCVCVAPGGTEEKVFYSGRNGGIDLVREQILFPTWTYNVTAFKTPDDVVIAADEYLLIGDENAFYKLIPAPSAEWIWEEGLKVTAYWAYAAAPPQVVELFVRRFAAHLWRTRTDPQDTLPDWAENMLKRWEQKKI